MRWDTQPVFSQEYRSLVKVREEKENVKTRFVKRVESTETDIKPVRPSTVATKVCVGSAIVSANPR